MRWFKRKIRLEIHHLYLRSDALPYRFVYNTGRIEFYSPARDGWVLTDYTREELLRDGFQELII